MKKVQKISTAILWVLMVVSVALFVILVSSIDDETNPCVQAVNMITINMNWAMILFVIAAAVVLFFAIAQTVTDKSRLVEALLVFVILGAILGVSYVLASGEIPTFFGVDKFVADGTLTTSVSKWVGTGLYAAYILFGASFLSIAGFSVANMFKKS